MTLKLVTSTLAFLFVTFGGSEVNSASLEVAEPVHQAPRHAAEPLRQQSDGEKANKNEVVWNLQSNYEYDAIRRGLELFFLPHNILQILGMQAGESFFLASLRKNVEATLTFQPIRPLMIHQKRNRTKSLLAQTYFLDCPSHATKPSPNMFSCPPFIQSTSTVPRRAQ